MRQGAAAGLVPPYAEDFAAGAWAKKGPGFVREARVEAMKAFATQGFPTTRDKDWHNTDLRPLAATRFVPAAGPMRSVAAPEVAPLRLAGAIELVFVDGHHVAELSRGLEHADPDEARIEALSSTLAHPSDDLEMHLARHAGDAGFVPLNTAFWSDGAFVHVAPRAELDVPIHLLHLATEPHAPTACHLRHLILAGTESEVTVVESYVGLASPDSGLTTAVTELVAGPGAQVRHVKLQRENLHAFHLGHLAIRADRDAHVTDHLMSIGARLSRHGIDAVLGGPGAETHLNGLFLGTGGQHVDCTTYVDHATPHTTSREVYKGVVDGQAHGVFLGNVMVRADAQKTDAAQTNRNLLLSNQAKVDTTPQLEIHADDVKCSHGSTIGQLSKDALFFLQSRGIAPEPARLMLTKAFAHEVLASAPPSVNGLMETLLTQWFACRKVSA